MSGEKLLESIGYVDEKYVDEAENETLKSSGGIRWMKWIAGAACLCIFAGYALGAWELFSDVRMEDSASESAQSNISMESIMENPEFDYADDSAEGPAAVLRVESLTQGGFTGTVVQPVNTEGLDVGTEVNVVLEMEEETAMEYTAGTVIRVRLRSFEPETGTIIGSVVEIISEPQGG